jgi:hypothetical protein
MDRDGVPSLTAIVCFMSSLAGCFRCSCGPTAARRSRSVPGSPVVQFATSTRNYQEQASARLSTRRDSSGNMPLIGSEIEHPVGGL